MGEAISGYNAGWRFRCDTSKVSEIQYYPPVSEELTLFKMANKILLGLSVKT